MTRRPLARRGPERPRGRGGLLSWPYRAWRARRARRARARSPPPACMWPGRVTRGLPDRRSAVGAHVRRTLRRMQPAGASTASGGGRPAQGSLHAPVPHWRALRSCLLAAVVGALVATPAVARATVTPSSGGTRGAFEVTFAAEPVALDLQISGPGKCAELDSLEISIRRAQSGRLRSVPGRRARGRGVTANGCGAGAAARIASTSSPRASSSRCRPAPSPPAASR